MTVRDGQPVWFELTTEDPAAAADFYAAIAGWRIASSPVAEHGGYRIAEAGAGTGAVAGIMAPPPGGGFPGWSVYFASRDVDAAAERVTALGGRLLFGPMDIPQVGRFATVADPQGVPFTLMSGDSAESPTAFRLDPGAVGHGVWTELASPDPDAAFAFYGALFGWEKAGAMPMGDMGEYAFIGDGEARPGAVMSSTLSGAPACGNGMCRWRISMPRWRRRPPMAAP
ncbi:hypothetical protein GCM10011380_16870 [Sphingomonas metalli]|uniref:VOC domain-containing protein n=1 Tax=Sphingomonas metalli TaxID=1779358 RepID=A0A916T1P6_9SPHN|nr:VOC family protein [Sphingomonas metalli]GGB27881.1 hypothetical protein GCM10011380_16870 [Sphingomonas metalli]